MCARVKLYAANCTQQTVVFSSLSSVNQPKENQVFCDTPELASCLGTGGVFHSDSVFPTPSHTCARPHTVFKIRPSLPIKTTGGAGGFGEDLPSLLPEATRSIHAHRHPALRHCCASSLSSSLHSISLGTAQSVPATGKRMSSLAVRRLN